MATMSILGAFILLLASCAFANATSNSTGSAFRYVALGDSYSSGPGAGKPFENTNATNDTCFRSQGSYPAILNRSLITSDFQFLSCSSDSAKNLTNWQSTSVSWTVEKTYISLSIGSGDAFLDKVAIWCLAMPPSLDIDGNCKKWMDKSWDLIRNKDKKNTFDESLSEVWYSLAEPNINSTTPGVKRYPPIIQTLYPRLFNAQNSKNTTKTCNNVSIFKSGPKLTEELRKSFNDLTDATNQRIADNLVQFKENEKSAGSIGQISLLDPNQIYEGHRLCEPYSGSLPGFNDPKTWFFGVQDTNLTQSTTGEVLSFPRDSNPKSCDEDSSDLTTALGCAYARANTAGKLTDEMRNGWNTTGVIWDKEDAAKFLLPNTAAHAKTASILFQHFNLLTPSQIVTRKTPIRVLPLGDSITNGYLSSDNNGYRKLFYDKAKEGGAINMVGSHKGLGNMTDNDEEGWNGFTINQISDKASVGLTFTPNVILLHAGTNDMGSDEAAVGAPERMGALIDKILMKRPDVALLVSTIVPSWDPARQARNNAFNNALQSLVETRRQSGKKIMQLFMDEVVLPSELIDGIHPTDEGYRRMALHWLQGLNDAAELEWLVPVLLPKWPTEGDIVTLSVLVGALSIASVVGIVLLVWYKRDELKKLQGRATKRRRLRDSQVSDDSLPT